MTTWRRSWAILVTVWALASVAVAQTHRLSGEGFLLNDEDNIVRYKVEDLKDKDGKIDKSKTVFVLKMKPGMWWKSIVLKHVVNGQEIQVFEIRTGDNKPQASIDILANNMRGDVRFILGKGGFLSFWRESTRADLDGDSLIGKRVTIDWQKD